MRIGGLQKISLSDYPGKISSILFTQGCNFRCAYCHNPELVDSKRFSTLIDEAEILAFLESRRKRIDALVITGGEPTIQWDLGRFLAALRSRGFKIKLDTNGSRPNVLARIIKQELIDYIAMDLKGPLQHYERIVSARVDPENIRQSIDLIQQSGLEHEFRTTLVPALLTPEEILETARLALPEDRFVLQTFTPSKALDPSFLNERPYPVPVVAQVREILEREARRVVVR